MRVFISGGCKNGKSHHAQRLAWAMKKSPLYYVATMSPHDAEDDERIRRHRLDREGWGFITIERPSDIEGILDICDCGGTFLLDSLTALLQNEMFPNSGVVNTSAVKKVMLGLSETLNRISNIVIVSDYIYSGSNEYDALTETYRRSLSELDRLAAKLCDVVLEASYGSIIVHKGGALYKTLL